MTTSTASLPGAANHHLASFSEFQDFNHAAEEIVATLRRVLGFDYWLVSRVVDPDWIVLRTFGEGPFKPGDALTFSSTICSHMITGHGPTIASDIASVQQYAQALIHESHVIAAYAGAPLVVNGEVFGVLCALDPVLRSDDAEKHTDLLATSARMLSTLLASQLKAEALQRRVERAEAEALIDELTSVYNRRGWDRLVRQEAVRAERYGRQNTVFLMDVDGLKGVNDRDGHLAGDTLLRRVAGAIQEVTRDNDIVARLGGDEFAMLAVETSAIDGQTLNERLDAAFERADVAVSIGRAHCSRHDDIAEAVGYADELMYEHKAHRAARFRERDSLITYDDARADFPKRS